MHNPAVPSSPSEVGFSGVEELETLALGGLRRMYQHEERMFSFRVRRDAFGEVFEGLSRRYTAIALLGLSRWGKARGDLEYGGFDLLEIGQRLLDGVDQVTELGDAALTLWAGVAVGGLDLDRARKKLSSFRLSEDAHPTVELSWALLAWIADVRDCGSDRSVADALAGRLLASFCEPSKLFPHTSPYGGGSWHRRHVSCFADMVYPIQALSEYAMLAGSAEALDAALRCGDRMCELQGSEGQWWWHFDVRTGKVIERYPVYAIHQDAMGPMALLALRCAGGADHLTCIARGLAWLKSPPGQTKGLIDHDAGWIWRKLARREPRKLSRILQAGASRVHSRLRVPLVNFLCPPRAVDFECRPYHFGWLLYAWAHRDQSV